MPTGPAGLMPALRRVVLATAAADRTDGQLLGAFVADRDADAFGALVRRHGPMVLGVCRRVIRDHAAADDAFQAVFLVLARRAAGVRPRERVGNYLYGIAYRTALKARAVLARRRSREKQVDVMPETPAPPPPDAWADLRPVIDEELARLPEKYRTPVVLCDLEGRPQREVARHLGLPAATLATRLAAARRTLAGRLTRRGVTLSGGAVAALLTTHGAAAAVPPASVHALVRAVEAVAAGAAVPPAVSAAAVQLSEGVMRMMMLTKLKAVAVLGLTAVALTGGLGLGLVPAYAGGDDPAPAAKAAPAAPAPAAEPPPGPPVPEDDVTFLKRLSLDLRGVPATDIEALFFVADGDENKRAKLVEWLLDDEAAVAHAAKKLGVEARRVRLVRPVDAGTGKAGGVVVLVAADEPKDRVKAVAFSPDGKTLAVEVVDELKAAPPGALDALVKRLVADEDVVVAAPAGDVLQYTVRRRQGEKPGDVLFWVEVAGHGRNPRAAELFTAGDDRTVRLWDAADGKALREWAAADGKRVLSRLVSANESDLDFLKRVTQAARGTPPTALEEKYFAEDKDPKKREKLVDMLLGEPAVAKKLGDDFKKKVLAGPGGAAAGRELGFFYDAAKGQKWVVPFEGKFVPFNPKDGPQRFEFKIELGPDGKPVPPTPPAPGARAPVPPKPPVPPVPPTPGAKVPPPPGQQPNVLVPKKVDGPAPPADKLGKLIDELLAAKKSDAEVLEAVTLVAAGRLPTDVERRLTLALVGKAADRKAAWAEVAKALAGGEKKDVTRERVAPPAK